jgi:hypothetical protein
VNDKEIDPRLRLQWEIARRAKAYRKDRKTEEFDANEIAEDLKKSSGKFQPGMSQLNLILEFDRSRLKEPQWTKYVGELFGIQEGWRSLDFRVHPLHFPTLQDHSRKSYEISKDVRVRSNGDTHDMLRFLDGFLTPKATDYADILLIRILDFFDKIIYQQGYASPNSSLKPLVRTEYKGKKPFYEAITLKDMGKVYDFYDGIVGHFVVKDCEKRNVSAHIAVEQGEGFVTRGDYIYGLSEVSSTTSKLSGLEEKIYEYFSRERKSVAINEVSQSLDLDFHATHMALVNLWKKCLLDRKRNDFIFTHVQDLTSWVVHANNAYEFIWNSNRSGENHPSKLPFDFDPSSWVSYPVTREVVNDFYTYLVQLGFKPKMRTTGGKIGGAHVVLDLDFNRVPKNYFNPFPRDKKFEKVIAEANEESLVVAAAADFMRSLALDFGIQRKKPTPITLETYNTAERMHNIYVDYTRCYLNTGVRSLGSIHHTMREGGPYVCIAWDGLLPESEKEVRSKSIMNFVFKNSEVLRESSYSSNENPFSLVEETFERTNWIPSAYARNPTKFYIKNIRRPI